MINLINNVLQLTELEYILQNPRYYSLYDDV